MIEIVWRGFVIVARLLVLFLVIYGFLKFSKLTLYNKYLHVIFCYYLIFETISFIFLNLLVKPILFMLPLYFFIEYLLYAFMFLYGFNLRKYKLIIVISIFSIALNLYFTYQSSVDYKPENYQLYGKVISNITIMTYVLISNFKSIENKIRRVDDKSFQFNSILLIYFSINLLVYLSFNFLINSEYTLYCYLVHGCNLITFYILNFYHIRRYTKI